MMLLDLDNFEIEIYANKYSRWILVLVPPKILNREMGNGTIHSNCSSMKYNQSVKAIINEIYTYK